MTITLAAGTLTLTYIAAQSQMVKVLTNAAEHLYLSHPLFVEGSRPPKRIPFADLTNAQRLAIIDDHVRFVIIQAARTQVANNAIATAQAAAAGDDQSIS